MSQRYRNQLDRRAIAGLVVLTLLIAGVVTYLGERLTSEFLADASKWLSYGLTIGFTSIAAAVTAYMVLRWHIRIRNADEAALAASERKFRAMFESIRDACFLLDCQYVICDCNQASLDMFGAESKENLVGRHPYAFSPGWQPNGRPTSQAASNHLKRAREMGFDRFEWVHRRLDGSEFPAEVCLTAVSWNCHRMIHAVIRDITEQKKAEEAIRESRRRFRDLADLLPESVWEVDLEGKFTFCNKHSFKAFGYDREDFDEGLHASQMIAPEEFDRLRRNMKKVFEGESMGGTEYTAIRKDGTTMPVRTYSSPIKRAGEVVGARGLVVDVSEQKAIEEKLRRANERLEKIASTDELTGLWNRRRFMQSLKREVRRAARYSRPLAFVMLDVDRFKSINDTCGHQVGDEVLREVGAALTSEARETDVPARYGGDEFVLLMPEATADQAVGAIERIRAALAEAALADEVPTGLALTAGVAATDADGVDLEDPESLVRVADQALYAAKAEGCNLTRTWSEVDEQDDDMPQKADMAALREKIRELSAQSRDAVLQSVQGLAQALEARDPYTGHHADNVIRYSEGIARTMGLEKEQIETIRRAASVHDVGKIGVPDAILRKAGPLTEAEREVMQGHVLIGVNILQQLRFLEREIPIVCHHHERWDGQGYPDGIAGEKIPLAARILAVADTFDAVTSDRVYREGRTVAEGLEILKAEAGRQFDPEVVEAMVEWVGSKNGDHPAHEVRAEELLGGIPLPEPV